MNREIKFRKLYGVAGENYTRWETVGVNEFKADNDDTDLSPWLQYTGLKDNNGKDVYESDIVRLYDRLHPSEIFGFGVVVYNAGCFMIQWIDDPEANMDLLGIDYFGRPTKIEVIGNIYETPQLLNKHSL